MAVVLIYTELAEWWPLLSPPEDYAGEAALISGLINSALTDLPDGDAPRRPRLLELGSGGGHNAVHLAGDFELTLVDISEPMLAVSRRLNPDVEHVQGDMRSIRLGRIVDAVVLHDALDYVVDPADLDATIATARAHLNPGGVAVLLPDHVRETFVADTQSGGSDDPDRPERGIRYLAWTFDPDPSDSEIVAEYDYLIRHPDGRIERLGETHRFGMHSTQDWLDALQRNGFEGYSLVLGDRPTDDEDDDPGRTVFIGRAV